MSEKPSNPVNPASGPALGPASDYVRIFDTTLRDGEQSPGATMTSAEKLEIALALAKLGVDVIETGFPAASPDDLLAVPTIAERVGPATIPRRRRPPPPRTKGGGPGGSPEH